MGIINKNLELNTKKEFVLNGELQLGQWQRVFAVELDRPRSRRIQIQLMGE